MSDRYDAGCEHTRAVLIPQIEELRRSIAIYLGEITQLRAEIEQLRALVKDLADDLEGELRGHYGPVMNYPSEKRRFERDMANVYEARRALE